MQKSKPGIIAKTPITQKEYEALLSEQASLNQQYQASPNEALLQKMLAVANKLQTSRIKGQ